jgi:hypothetical protein
LRRGVLVDAVHAEGGEMRPPLWWAPVDAMPKWWRRSTVDVAESRAKKRTG